MMQDFVFLHQFRFHGTVAHRKPVQRILVSYYVTPLCGSILLASGVHVTPRDPL